MLKVASSVLSKTFSTISLEDSQHFITQDKEKL